MAFNFDQKAKRSTAMPERLLNSATWRKFAASAGLITLSPDQALRNALQRRATPHAPLGVSADCLQILYETLQQCGAATLTTAEAVATLFSPSCEAVASGALVMTSDSCLCL
jgi:hypothetical protein